MDSTPLADYIKIITTPRAILACTAVCITIFAPNMARIFGYAKTKYFHSNNSIQLTLKDGTKTTFGQLCQSVIPPCRLNPFLFNGHLQTIWTAFVKRETDIYYKRWVFENEDPAFAGQFAVDFVTKPYTDKVEPNMPPRTTHYTREEFDAIGSDDSRPMLVMLHGLSGGSHELYLREVLAKLVTDDRAWEACVVNSRGCAETKITTSVLYNARSTWDVRQVVKWLRLKFPNRPLFGCGFSLGANIITNYIGEEGEKCVFKAAVVFSSPWNLETGNRALQRTWFGLNIYSRAMGTSLKALFNRHIEQLSKNPNFDIDAIQNLTYLHEFDALVQAPSWGYPTAAAYYRDASSSDSLMNIRIPFLAISAEDDPIVSHEALPYEEMQVTPYGVLCTTALGGHLSWFEFGGGRWFADAGSEWLQTMAHEVDLESIPQPKFSPMNDNANEQADGRSKSSGGKPVYQPIRRKWHVPGQD